MQVQSDPEVKIAGVLCQPSKGWQRTTWPFSIWLIPRVPLGVYNPIRLNPTEPAAAALGPPARDKFRAGPGGHLELCRRRDGGRGDECRRLKSPCRFSGGDI